MGDCAAIIDGCQWVRLGGHEDEESDPMTVRELPVLDQPEVGVCCAPLSVEVLSQSDAKMLAWQFAALGDPVRLHLLALFAPAEGGAVCVCDLTEPVGRSQGTV